MTDSKEQSLQGGGKERSEPFSLFKSKLAYQELDCSSKDTLLDTLWDAASIASRGKTNAEDYFF